MSRNTNIKNNYFRVEATTDGLNSDPTTSYTAATGANSGFFVVDQLVDENEKTGSHGVWTHAWIETPQCKGSTGQPDIMATQNNDVDKKYQEKKVKKQFSTPDLDKAKRKVTQANIDDLGLDKLKYDKNGRARLAKSTNKYHTK